MSSVADGSQFRALVFCLFIFCFTREDVEVVGVQKNGDFLGAAN